MNKKCIDHIGQEIVVGDWAAVTQNNIMYVGQVIKATSTVTIALDSMDEFRKTDKSYLTAKWQDQEKIIKNKFGPKATRWVDSPSWIRHGKFVKINPTDKMIVDYDV